MLRALCSVLARVIVLQPPPPLVPVYRAKPRAWQGPPLQASLATLVPPPYIPDTSCGNFSHCDYQSSRSYSDTGDELLERPSACKPGAIFKTVHNVSTFEARDPDDRFIVPEEHRADRLGGQSRDTNSCVRSRRPTRSYSSPPCRLLAADLPDAYRDRAQTHLLRSAPAQPPIFSQSTRLRTPSSDFFQLSQRRLLASMVCTDKRNQWRCAGEYI